jgi:hypothetical protein
MSNAKSLVFVIASLMFLVSGAICGQLLVFPVWAAPMHPCFDGGCPGYRNCINEPGRLKATCCWKEPGVIPPEINCQTCNVNTDTGEFEDCHDAQASEGLLGPGVIAPPPSGVAPPPPTETCPENTALDAQGNCTPLTQGPQETLPSPEEIVPPSGSVGPLQGGTLEQLEQGEGLQQGFFEQQQQQPPADQGAAELAPPTSEETQPATVEEEQPVPVCQEGLEFNEDLGFCVPEDCPEGQVLDEDSGICVLEEPEAAEDPAQSAPEEEQQPAEEEDGLEDNNNN